MEVAAILQLSLNESSELLSPSIWLSDWRASTSMCPQPGSLSFVRRAQVDRRGGGVTATVRCFELQ